LRRSGDKLFLVLKPSVEVRDVYDREVAEDESRAVKLEVFGWRHNHKSNEELEHWRKKLLTGDPTTIEVHPINASPFRFRFLRPLVLGAIRDQALMTNALDVAKLRRNVMYPATIVREPLGRVPGSRDGRPAARYPRLRGPGDSLR
jgi:hypothetical protein